MWRFMAVPVGPTILRGLADSGAPIQGILLPEVGLGTLVFLTSDKFLLMRLLQKIEFEFEPLRSPPDTRTSSSHSAMR